MLVALKRKSADAVGALIDDDPNLVFTPIKAPGRTEPLLFFALRIKSPVKIVRLLLSKGASPIQPGLNSLILLTTLSTSPWELKVPLTLVPSSVAFRANARDLLSDHSRHLISISCDVDSITVPKYQHQHHRWQLSNPTHDLEEYELSVAACLLWHGADPFEKDSNNLCAVEYATKARKTLLANLMQNWSEWEECRLHRRIGVLSLPEDITQHVYDFLLPRMWQF
jgi:hypothetical protein